MDFEYTPEQIQLRKSVREFAEAEIAPHVMEWDEAQTFPLEVVKKLGRLGYMGSVFPEEYGGAGLGYIEYSILIEELSRVDGSVGIIVAAHTSLCSNHIYKAGTEEQRSRYLSKLATGEWLGCWSLTEPEAGSDAAGTRTTAVRQGECWVLNGAKTFTTNAHYADVCVAMAMTDRGAAQHGISAFIIEKDTPGFRTGKKENKLGLRASATGEVIFQNCRLPATQLLGKRGEGFVDSLKTLDGGRISIAALALGMAQGAYDAALKYSKLRRQFSRPISEFQAIQHKLVDMATDIDAARLLIYRAAYMLDQGRRVTRESAMAKLFASEAAVRIANEAVQIHGGYGFIKDYPVEKFYRDVKLCTIGEGTSEIQRLVIARRIIERLMPDLAAKIAAGDVRALARAATAIENQAPEAREVLRELAPRAGHAIVVGITGPPGAGKSTLVDALTRSIRRAGKTVGILAVDPTSRISGGAIMGDRIRMQAHHGDPGVYIRSMATRGAPGGLARATADLALLLDAAGKDYVLIETVGVGQDEVDIARVADITVLVLVPGMGDDVQAIKAGIMEIADIFVINKADHPGAERVQGEIEGALSLGHREDGWTPPIVRAVATEEKGIAELLDAIREYPRRKKSARRMGEFAIDHLGVAVKSIEAALGFYLGQLGMQVAMRETVAHEKVHVAMLPAGGPRIELLEPAEADSVIGRFLAKRGEGLHHVALRVPDLCATVERLRAAGARLLNEPQTGAGGHRYVFVHPASTGGVLLELIEDGPFL